MQASVKLLLDLLRLGADRVQPSLVDISRLVQIRDFWSNVALDEDLDVLHKWIRLVAERLNVRGTVEPLHVVPDSLVSPYSHNSLLDIEELMKEM